MRIIYFLCVAVALFLGLSVRSATAQGLTALLPGASVPTEETAEAPPASIEDVIREAARNGIGILVIDAEGNLRPPATPPEGAVPLDEVVQEHSALMNLQDRATRFRAALLERLVDLPNAFNEVLYILRAASPDGTLWAFAKTLVLSLLMLSIGVIAEREIFAKRFARKRVLARVKENPQGYSEKMPFLLYRFVLSVVGIIVSMVVAYIVGYSIFGTLEDTAIQFTVTLINIGYFICRFVASLWRMILSPYLSQYRIPALSDRDARRLHRWLWMLATFDVCAILFGIWIGELGLNYDVYAFLASMLSAGIVLMNILLVLVNRRAISGALQNGRPMEDCSLVTRTLVRIWAPTVIIYVLFAWVELTYDLVLANPSSIPLIAGAYGILVSIIVVYGGISYVIERYFSRARTLRRLNAQREEALALKAEEQGLDDAASAPPPEGASIDPQAARLSQGQRHSLNSFEALARRVAGILAFVAGAYAFFYIWDNESARMAESYADRLLDILVIVFIGYVVYHAFRIWIDSKIEDEIGDLEEPEPGDEGGGSSATRLATLLPLFRNVVLIVVVVTILLIVLMEIGVNVGPLFAGAGIVGIAIGFGSQALVRDIFAGAFFLFDDAFRKGEYLDVGGVKGTVEKISVRSFQLRHHLGYLHTIPFGELQVMTNFSRDWVMMKLPLRVTYDTDVEKVRKLIKKLGQELLDDPVIGENFIQPLKSQGVIEMQDSAMIIRVKFMTKPGDQWLVRKRVYEEIRALFEREGIRFAHREVTVRLADGKLEELSEEQKRAVTAAAQASFEQEEAEEPEGPVGDDR